MMSDESFPKEGRLVKTKDFRKVYKEGVSFKKGGFILYNVLNGIGKNRIGFSIPSKIIKRASSRNRIRRLLREAYRRKKRDLKKGYDIVLVVKKNLYKPILYDYIEGAFLKLVKEAGLIEWKK